MKAYRFECREETKWQWGFWAFYFFTITIGMVIGSEMDEPLLTLILCVFAVLIILIIQFDFVGYKIRRKKQ